MPQPDIDPNLTTMAVKIYSPSDTFFDGKAKVVSASNDTGPFDVLPQHHSFITLLSAGKVGVVTLDESKQEFDIDGGLMRVRDNTVTIFIGF